MDIKVALKNEGFDPVILLDAAECGEEGTLVLAFRCYLAEAAPAEQGAWIHPYYPASQSAYHAAMRVLQTAAAEGIAMESRNDIRLKPLFARIPGMTRGRNTLSYLPGTGSRFHVQVFLLKDQLLPEQVLLPEPQPLHCGNCTNCIQACPSGAIDQDGYHREKCIRNWMMSGKPVPVALRSRMGQRLIGCDECQRCCPHNPAPKGETGQTVSIQRLLTQPKEVCDELRPQIGTNLTIVNRVLSQACMIAGCSGAVELIPQLEKLKAHPSATVSEHAAWAAEVLCPNRINDESKGE